MSKKDKNMYEKQIALLEGENETLRNDLARLRDSNKAEVDAALKQRDGLLASIHNFMNRLYSQLGNVQSELLTNMSSLNNATMEVRSTMIKRKAPGLAMLGHQNLEEEA